MWKMRIHYTTERLVEWLLALMLILEVNTVFSESFYFNFHIPEIACALASFLGLIIICTFKKIKAETFTFILLYELLAILFLVISIDSKSIMTYSAKFIIFLPLMILIYTLSPEVAVKILEIQSKIVVILAFMSLIMWLFGAILHILPSMGSFAINWGGFKSRTIYGVFLFSGQMSDLFGIRIARNTGIFTEGPMYGFVLVMALATQMFGPTTYSRNKKSTLILILAIVTTMSVAAQIVVIVMLLGKMIFFGNRNSVLYSWLIRLIVIAVGIPISVLVINKMMSLKMSTGHSYSIRMDDYLAGFSAWKANPILGVGYGNGATIVTYMQRNTKWGAGYSNAVMYILATCGIYGGFLYAYSIVRGIYISIKRKKLGIAAMFIVFVTMLVTTFVPMQLFVLNYLAMGATISVYEICDSKEGI